VKARITAAHESNIIPLMQCWTRREVALLPIPTVGMYKHVAALGQKNMQSCAELPTLFTVVVYAAYACATSMHLLTSAAARPLSTSVMTDVVYRIWHCSPRRVRAKCITLALLPHPCMQMQVPLAAASYVEDMYVDFNLVHASRHGFQLTCTVLLCHCLHCRYH
jgi:hypothetical protein